MGCEQPAKLCKSIPNQSGASKIRPYVDNGAKCFLDISTWVYPEETAEMF